MAAEALPYVPPDRPERAPVLRRVITDGWLQGLLSSGGRLVHTPWRIVPPGCRGGSSHGKNMQYLSYPAYQYGASGDISRNARPVVEAGPKW